MLREIIRDVEVVDPAIQERIKRVNTSLEELKKKIRSLTPEEVERINSRVAADAALVRSLNPDFTELAWEE